MAGLTPEQRKPIRLRGMTGAQVQAVELAVGKPFLAWDEAPSVADLMAQVAAQVNGGEPADYLAIPFSDLTKIVNITDDEDDDPGNG